MTESPSPGAGEIELDQLASAIVRTVQGPLLVLDADLRVLTANPAFYETFGISHEETVGEQLWRLGENRWDIPALREQLMGLLEGGDPVVDFEVEHDFGSVGNRILEITARRIEREADDLILLAMADVTQRIQAVRARQQMLDDLAESNRELERFAYVASHDLQEPLRMISSYTELLARRYKGELDEKADKYIEYAADGARRMQAMIEGLLQYSRVSRMDHDFEPVDLNQLLIRVRRDLSNTLEEADGTLEVADLPTVPGDATRLEQVFRNLIANAIKFRDEDPPEIRVTAEREEDTWRIGVHDNGIGIDPAYFDKVFEIFNRLNPRREYPGAGLGLALCQKIVEYHRGQLEVESEPGVGSSFFMTLPILENDND